MKVICVKFSTLVLALLCVLNSWQSEAKTCTENHIVFHSADADNLCRKCALAQGNGVSHSSLSCQHLDNLLDFWNKFVKNHLPLEESYSIDSPLTKFMHTVIGDLMEKNTVTREKYKHKISSIAIVGPFSTDHSANQYQLEHDLYQQVESLTFAHLTEPNLPILKVPSLEKTFLRVRPELSYHLYMYNNDPQKRLFFQTLTTMLRLVLERYTLDVATVILDQTELDQVIILNSESLCDEDILDIYVDMNIPTKWVVNDETTPYSLNSFYKRIIHGTGQGNNFFDDSKFKDWYQGAIYLKNQGDRSGWITKHRPGLKTFFFPFNMIEVELANEQDSNHEASCRINVEEKISSIANVDITSTLRLLTKNSPSGRVFRRKSIIAARPNTQSLLDSTGLLGLFVNLRKAGDMEQFASQESKIDADEHVTLDERLSRATTRDYGYQTSGVNTIYSLLEKQQHEQQEDTLADQQTPLDWGDIEINFDSSLRAKQDTKMRKNANMVGEVAAQRRVTN